MEWVKLGDVAIIHDGKRIPLNNTQRLEKSTNPIYPYYGANGLVDYIDEYIFDKELPILCIAEDGGNWGFNEKCSYIIEEKCWVNNHAHVITVNDNYNLNYINYYLNYSDLNKYITGTTRGKLTQKELKNISIPNISLEVQNKIVFELRKVENLIQTRQDQIQALDELVESVFDELSNKNNVRFTALDELITKKPDRLSNKNTDPISYFDISSIDNISHKIIEEKNILNLEDRPSRAKQLIMEDDVIVSTVRPNLKNIAYFDYKNTYIPVASTGFAVLRANKSILNPKYLFHIVLTNYFTNLLISVATGANYPAVKESDVRNIKVPIIDIEKQNQFAAFVEKIEKQKQILNDSLKELIDLFDSLMQDAFDGSMTM